MSTLNRILELLKDGKWHTLKEINKEAGFQEDELEKIMRFFAEYKFIQIDKQRERAKLTPPALEFLKKPSR